MVTIHDGDPYTSAISNAFAVAFRKHGGTVPGRRPGGERPDRHGRRSRPVRGSRPRWHVHPALPSGGKLLDSTGSRLGALKGVKRISGAATLAAKFLALPESEGVYFTGPDLGDSRNTNQATGRSAADVLTEFKAASGGPPTSPYWAHGYDATTLLLSAIKQIAVVDGRRCTSTARHSVTHWMAPQVSRASSARLPAMTSGTAVRPQRDTSARGLQRHRPVTPAHCVQGCAEVAPASISVFPKRTRNQGWDKVTSRKRYAIHSIAIREGDGEQCVTPRLRGGCHEQTSDHC